MSGDEQDLTENKFWHRKQCSNRVFIGPWDIKTPALPEQLDSNEIESPQSVDSDSSLKLLNK
jgi:hypothetical protein